MMKHNTNKHCWSSYTTIEQFESMQKSNLRDTVGMIAGVAAGFVLGYITIIILMGV